MAKKRVNKKVEKEDDLKILDEKPGAVLKAEQAAAKVASSSVADRIAKMREELKKGK